MDINFQCRSLEDKEFTDLFQLADSELEKMGAIRMIVDSDPGYPCRVSLEDARIGEEVLLLPYQHHKTNSPYQASGPIFVRKLAKTASLKLNEIPKMLDHRLLSLRGYDSNGILREAMVSEGNVLPGSIQNLFANNEITYIHVHNAKPGCYNCSIERISN